MAAIIAAVVVVVGVGVAAAVVFLGSDDETPVAVVASETPTALPTSTTVPTPSTTTAPLPSEVATATPQPTPTLQVGGDPTEATQPPANRRFFASLDEIIPDRILGADLDTTETSDYLIDELGADDGRFLFYKARRTTFSHLVGLFADKKAAGAALQRRVRELVRDNGFTVVDDTRLQDSDGRNQGRLVEVRTTQGALIVQWTNRNLLGVVGPEPPRRARRLYASWPY